MDNLVYILLVLMTANYGSAITSLDCENRGTTGTRFVFAVPNSYSTPSHIAVHISCMVTTQVTVDAPYVHFKHTYTVDHILVNISNSIQHTSSGYANKAIIVTSGDPCSVTVLPHDFTDNTEGFLVLPVTALSTDYVVSSAVPYHGSSSGSEFLMIALENNTKIYQTLYENGRYAGTHNSTLNQYATYQYMSRNDLSGTIIKSDKPIAVISGVTDGRLPTNMGDYQFMVEQLIPVKYWAREYIIPQLYPRLGYYYRVYGIGTGNTSGSYVRVRNSTATVIISQDPLSVIQYGDDGSDDCSGDPFMTTVQAMSQYQSRYDFLTDFTPFGSNIYNVTLVVTARTSDLPGIMLDNKLSIYNAGVLVQVPPPFDNYTIVYYNMTQETYGMYHTLLHTSGHRFGAMIYSFPHGAAAYGYPLGLQLTNEACWRTTTTTTTTTTTPATTTTTTTRSPTTDNMQFNNSTNGPMHCFNCHDIPHLKYCDHVTTCSGNEVCYVEKYNNIYGELLYRSGCMDKQICTSSHSLTDCLECCEHGDYCNRNGCGDIGIQDVSDRGPYCFDCHHVGNADECHSVQVCQHGQVCMIEKYVWGPNDFNYAMGCVHSNVCQRTKRSVDVRVLDHQLAARHLPACTHCCTTDFCNNNCTQINHQVLIG